MAEGVCHLPSAADSLTLRAPATEASFSLHICLSASFRVSCTSQGPRAMIRGSAARLPRPHIGKEPCMSRFPWLIVGLVVLAATACAPSVNVEQERAALMAADRDWSETTKDPEKFVSFFGDGAAIYAPGMPIVTGAEAIRKSYTEMSKAPGFALSWYSDQRRGRRWRQHRLHRRQRTK